MATTPAATSTTNRQAAASLISALGAGSGTNIQQLAQSLVDAEKAPKEKLINDKIDAAKKQITGYGGLMFVLSEAKKAFDDLNDSTDFAGLNVKNSQSNAFELTTNASADPGLHDIKITKVAKPQRSLSDSGYADRNVTALSGGGFTLTLKVAGADDKPIAIPANATLDGIKDAINTAKVGVTAQVVDSCVEGAADRYKIMITGSVGASNAFTLVSSQPGTLNYATDGVTNLPVNTIQQASNAQLTVNGINYVRSSNSVIDVIPGVTLDLLTETTGTASVQLSRDTTALKTKLDRVVSTYNDFQNFIKVATDPKSTDPDFGGVLAQNSVAKATFAKLKQMVFATASSSANANVRGLRDLGVKLQDDGTLTIDESTYSKTSTNYYDQVVTMFSGRNLVNERGGTVDGVAAAFSKWASTQIGASGPLLQGSQNDERKISQYQEQLTKLQSRMDLLLTRYTKQFAAMDAFVGQANSLKSSLKSTFENMNPKNN